MTVVIIESIEWKREPCRRPFAVRSAGNRNCSSVSRVCQQGDYSRRVLFGREVYPSKLDELADVKIMFAMARTRRQLIGQSAFVLHTEGGPWSNFTFLCLDRRRHNESITWRKHAGRHHLRRDWSVKIVSRVS